MPTVEAFVVIIPSAPEVFLRLHPYAYRCLEFLLQNDANPSIRDKEGYNSIHYAAAYGHRQCLELVSCRRLFFSSIIVAPNSQYPPSPPSSVTTRNFWEDSFC